MWNFVLGCDIITSRISKEAKLPRASENIESLIRANALRLRRSLRLAQWNHDIIASNKSFAAWREALFGIRLLFHALKKPLGIGIMGDWRRPEDA
jgi:hypothetical protein